MCVITVKGKLKVLVIGHGALIRLTYHGTECIATFYATPTCMNLS